MKQKQREQPMKTSLAPFLCGSQFELEERETWFLLPEEVTYLPKNIPEIVHFGILRKWD